VGKGQKTVEKMEYIVVETTTRANVIAESRNLYDIYISVINNVMWWRYDLFV
jgi:hypothetical protein